MLVLTRRVGQAIFVGDCKVVVSAITRDGRVRLAIEAPPHVEIDREEIRAAKEAERKGRRE